MVDAAPILELRNVVKTYPGARNAGPIQVLDHVNFAVTDEEAGEFVALLGPSGSGKSTILNLISGLSTPDSGEVLMKGEPVGQPNMDSATVPQSYTCFPWRTVLGNVEFGMEVAGVEQKERRARAMEYLEKVGLADRANAYPKELSGGMQQRVAIARALVMKPPMVLMDEPFGALDAQTRDDMQQMLMKLWSAEKNMIFFITHDIAEAVLLADRIIVLSTRPARVVQDLRVPLNRPRTRDMTTTPLFGGVVQQIMAVLRNPTVVA